MAGWPEILREKMEAMKVIFKNGLYGKGRKTGQINIVKPSCTLYFSKEQLNANKVLEYPMQGSWDFPRGLVSKMQAVVKTGADYKGNWGKMIPINGAPQGEFKDLLYIYPTDKSNITTVRFDIFDKKEQLKWRYLRHLFSRRKWSRGMFYSPGYQK